MKKLTYYSVRYKIYGLYDRCKNLGDPLGYVYLKRKNALKRMKEMDKQFTHPQDCSIYIQETTLYFKDGE